MQSRTFLQNAKHFPFLTWGWKPSSFYTNVEIVLNRNAVLQQSPASRSARWVREVTRFVHQRCSTKSIPAIVQPRWGRMREYSIPRVRSATLGFVVKRRWRFRRRLQLAKRLPCEAFLQFLLGLLGGHSLTPVQFIYCVLHSPMKATSRITCWISASWGSSRIASIARSRMFIV